MKKYSGVLTHVSSLPSEYGIGTFGKSAYDFVDFLAKAKQSYWQILPLGPTSFGDSPYSSFSAFAGNPYFIDLDILAKEGLLKKKDYKDIKWFRKENKVDYSTLYKKRFKVLRIAFHNFKADSDFFKFIKENNKWLDDYSLYMSIKTGFKGKSWLDWSKQYRLKDKAFIKQFKSDNYNELKFWKFVQYEFFKQWNSLKEYANSKNIKIIGDCPIYVSLDSADVWANQEIFKLNKEGTPKCVAGVPPDYFSKDGQLWGNPLYDWNYLKKNNYKWWIDRLKHYEKMYDVLRIDHFIGFVSYYSIKYGSKNARNGKMNKGPGIDLINTINKKIKHLDIVAEDLGVVTKPVRDLLKASKYPGMRVMRFGYDGNLNNDNLVKNYPTNTVAYLTSHDTETCLEWYKSLNASQKKIVKSLIMFNKDEDINWNLINELMSSNAYLTIIQAQDLLGLGKGSRMNTPGSDKGNWTWRANKNDFNNKLANKLAKYCEINGRIA